MELDEVCNPVSAYSAAFVARPFVSRMRIPDGRHATSLAYPRVRSVPALRSFIRKVSRIRRHRVSMLEQTADGHRPRTTRDRSTENSSDWFLRHRTRCFREISLRWIELPFMADHATKMASNFDVKFYLNG